MPFYNAQVTYETGVGLMANGAPIDDASLVSGNENLLLLSQQLSTDASGNLVIPANLVPRAGTESDLLLNTAGYNNELALSTDTRGLVLMTGVAGAAKRVVFPRYSGVDAAFSGYDNTVAAEGFVRDTGANTASGNFILAPNCQITVGAVGNQGLTTMTNNMIIASPVPQDTNLASALSLACSNALVIGSIANSVVGNSSTQIGVVAVGTPLPNQSLRSISGRASTSLGREFVGLAGALTTDATATILTPDVGGGTYTTFSFNPFLVSTGVAICDIIISAMKNDTTQLTAVWRRRLVCKRASTAVALVGSIQGPDTTNFPDVADAGFAPTFTLSVSTTGIVVTATGLAATNIRWKAICSGILLHRN